VEKRWTEEEEIWEKDGEKTKRLVGIGRGEEENVGELPPLWSSVLLLKKKSKMALSDVYLCCYLCHYTYYLVKADRNREQPIKKILSFCISQ
jgi:hypothetical protein